MGRAGARSPAVPGGPGGRGTGHGLGHGPGRVRRAARRRGSLLLPEPGERPGGRAREPRAYAPLADWLRAASIINPAVGIGWARGVGGGPQSERDPKGGYEGRGGPGRAGSARERGSQGQRGYSRREGTSTEKGSSGGEGVPRWASPAKGGPQGKQVPRVGQSL